MQEAAHQCWNILWASVVSSLVMLGVDVLLRRHCKVGSSVTKWSYKIISYDPEYDHLNNGAIAFLPLFWTSIVILPPFSSTLCFYLCFSKTKVQFTPTPWTVGNGVKKVDRWQVCPSEYCVFAPISNPNCDFTPTFFHFVFLPLLF